LLAAGLGLRLWVIAHSEVAARDSIGYVRYALRLEREPWADVVRSVEQPPGYAATVLAVSWPVRAWTGRTDCDTMILSAQLASALLAALSIVPMVLLGRDLAGRAVAWLAAAIFLTLPAWLRLTSDGVSEGTFLFWLATSAWLAVRAVRAPTAGRLFLCGLTCGCAYLTRPEGGEIAAATLAILIGMQFVAGRRQRWARLAPQALALAAGVVVFAGPYVKAIGGLSNKNTVKLLSGDPNVDRTGLTPGTMSQAGGGRTPLAVWWFEPLDKGKSRSAWAWWAIATETFQSFHYATAVLALGGLTVWRTRRAARPGGWLLVLLIAAHALVLWRMAATIGYLSERHTLMFVFAGCFPAAATLVWYARFHRALPILGLAGLIAAGAPALAKPLHGNRCGHKPVGLWLAAHVGPDDQIDDPFGWAEFYSGRLAAVPPPKNPARTFIVLETSENQHSRLPGMTYAREKAKYGKVVHHWPEDKPREAAQILVYEVPGVKP
jgi:hypothetical protein